MKSSQPKQQPTVELKQKKSNVTLHIFKDKDEEEKVPLKANKLQIDPSTPTVNHFNLGSLISKGLQKIISPSASPNHSQSKSLSKSLSKSSTKSTSKTPDEFAQLIRENTVLESLRSKIIMKKKQVRDEEMNGRLHKFNNEIKELINEVQFKIDAKDDVIKQIEEEDQNPAAKMQRVAEFREENDTYKDEIEKKLTRAESVLLENTKKELYDHLKVAIVNPIWEAQVNQNFGGKKVIKSESPKTTVHVPTGIEKMIRILSNSTLSKSTACCCARLFSRTTLASRITAQNDEELSAKKTLKKIKQLTEIAKERLNTSKYTRCEVTKRFYAVIAGIDVEKLEDFETLNEYVFKFEQINRDNNLVNFLMKDEEGEEENIRRRPTIADVP